jgi:hypothetical protein
MTDSDRDQIVERMFPDWQDHLIDGRIIDHILKGLSRCGHKATKRRARVQADGKAQTAFASRDEAPKHANTGGQDASDSGPER